MHDDKYTEVTCKCDRCGITESTHYYTNQIPSTAIPTGWSIVNRSQFSACGAITKPLEPCRLCTDCTTRLKMWLMNPEEYDKFDENMLSIYRACRHCEMHGWL